MNKTSYLEEVCIDDEPEASRLGCSYVLPHQCDESVSITEI